MIGSSSLKLKASSSPSTGEFPEAVSPEWPALRPPEERPRKGARCPLCPQKTLRCLWGRQTENKPAAFSLDHKPADNTVDPTPQHHQNFTDLPTMHFEKHALASGRKTTGSECVLLKACAFQIIQNYGLMPQWFPRVGGILPLLSISTHTTFSVFSSLLKEYFPWPLINCLYYTCQGANRVQ
jgi:hypothetical protein